MAFMFWCMEFLARHDLTNEANQSHPKKALWDALLRMESYIPMMPSELSAIIHASYWKASRTHLFFGIRQSALTQSILSRTPSSRALPSTSFFGPSRGRNSGWLKEEFRPVRLLPEKKVSAKIYGTDLADTFASLCLLAEYLFFRIWSGSILDWGSCRNPYRYRLLNVWMYDDFALQNQPLSWYWRRYKVWLTISYSSSSWYTIPKSTLSFTNLEEAYTRGSDKVDMKLNVDQLRYLSKDDFRTLQAVELGQKNVGLWPFVSVPFWCWFK